MNWAMENKNKNKTKSSLTVHVIFSELLPQNKKSGIGEKS